MNYTLNKYKNRGSRGYIKQILYFKTLKKANYKSIREKLIKYNRQRGIETYDPKYLDNGISYYLIENDDIKTIKNNLIRKVKPILQRKIELDEPIIFDKIYRKYGSFTAEN